jgi:N6-L-threonylcarbamoyladenine synthase
MYTLGIETSCDETAAAVLENERVLSNVVSSQILVHKKYGGVVPELASREHLRNLLPVVRAALAEAGVSLVDINLVAATHAPGLIGALLVGVSAAKAIAYGRGIPWIGVHHGEGHILAARIEHPDIPHPYIALLVSGGHTALYLVPRFGEYQLLGQTRDDAAGEAYDKAAKLLGLDYPGGPEIDRLASEGNAGAIRFPRGKIDGWDFSFSGLKTAVRNHIAGLRKDDAATALPVADIAAAFQAAAIEMLTEKTVRAAAEFKAKGIVVAGGVAANSGLRAALKTSADSLGLPLFIPSLQYCADNAAMIALAGYLRHSCGETSSLGLNPRPACPLPACS